MIGVGAFSVRICLWKLILTLFQLMTIDKANKSPNHDPLPKITQHKSSDLSQPSENKFNIAWINYSVAAMRRMKGDRLIL